MGGERVRHKGPTSPFCARPQFGSQSASSEQEASRLENKGGENGRVGLEGACTALQGLGSEAVPHNFCELELDSGAQSQALSADDPVVFICPRRDPYAPACHASPPGWPAKPVAACLHEV